MTAEPPDSLSDDARDIWHRLAPCVPDGRLTDATADQFAMLCAQIATWHEATADLNDTGLTTWNDTSQGPNLMLAIRNTADQTAARWAKEFGLDPATQARIAQPDQPAQKPQRLRHLREA